MNDCLGRDLGKTERVVVACADSLSNWNSISKSSYRVAEEMRFCCCQVGVRLMGLCLRSLT